VVVVDDVVVEIRSKARVEAIVDKATKESYVVWVELSFVLSSHMVGHVRRRNPMCQLPLSARMSMRSWLSVMQIMLRLKEWCEDPSPHLFVVHL
jgi:hypothetical protein